MPPRVRIASSSASSARRRGVEVLLARFGGRAGLDRGDVALGRAEVPPPPPVGVAVRGRADREVVALRPSRGGCAGTRRRAAPNSRSRTTRSRRRAACRRRSRTCRPGRRRPARGGRRLAMSRPSGVPGSTVSAYTLTWSGLEREHAVEAAAPVVDRLARRAVDEVEVEVLEAGCTRPTAPRARRRRDRGCGRARRARAAASTAPRTRAGSRRRRRRSRAGPGSTESGLHSTVTSAPAARSIASRMRARPAAGISDGVPPPKKTLVAGAPGASAICRRDVGDAGVHVLVDEVAAVGPGREVAVVTAVRAERDVDVDAEGHPAILPLPCGLPMALTFELPPEAESYRGGIRDVPRRARARTGSTRPTGPSGSPTNGYVTPHWPRPWGRDASPIEQLVIDEELKRAFAPKPMNPIGIGWAGPTLLVAGTPEQQARYLPGLLDGSEIWCQLFSEPEAGSDLASLQTTRGARRRRVRAQRPEGVDDARAVLALRDPARPHRSRRGAAQGHLVLRARHAVARHHGPAHQADGPRRDVQRGLLRRRAHPRGEPHRRRSTTAGGSPR